MADTQDDKAVVVDPAGQGRQGDQTKDEGATVPDGSAAEVDGRPRSPESFNIESVNSEDEDGYDDSASRISAHRSIGGENPVEPVSSFVEVPDEFYDRIPAHRKLIIVAVLSYCSFLAPISSTTVLSAIPEVAEEYNTTGAIVGVSNALYMLFMGISPIVWGPLSQVYGRRVVSLYSCLVVVFLPLHLRRALGVGGGARKGREHLLTAAKD